MEEQSQTPESRDSAILQFFGGVVGGLLAICGAVVLGFFFLLFTGLGTADEGCLILQSQEYLEYGFSFTECRDDGWVSPFLMAVGAVAFILGFKGGTSPGFLRGLRHEFVEWYNLK